MTGSLRHYTATEPGPPPAVLAAGAGPDADAELASLAAGGDAEAFAALYERYSNLLLAMAMRIVRNRQDAEEVLQEAFLYAWKNLEHYDPRRSSLVTWLVLITRSRSLDRLRSVRADGRMKTEYGRDETPVQYPKGAAKVLDRERSDRVVSALQELPAAQRRVLELAYYRGLSQREVAERTGIPLGTVKTRTALAMKKLRQTLADEVRYLM